MRIIVSGGGSAGHVSPVLATVDALRSLDKNLEVLFIGQRGGMEEKLARSEGLAFKGVFGGKFRRVPGSGLSSQLRDRDDLMRNLRDVFGIIVGTIQCLVILRRFKPDAIFNKAGTVGIPVGLASKLLGIPMIIHEPDAVPGLNNRLLSHWATFVAVGFPAESYRNFAATKLVYTGNPVQAELLDGKKAAAVKELSLDVKLTTLLVVGGSQGALDLNTALLTNLAAFTKKVQVIHVAGVFDYDRVKRRAAEQSIDQNRYKLFPYLQYSQMTAAYAAADIVVARAGANTIAELAALRKPVVLVPNESAAAHQLKNARELASSGAALLASDGNPESLHHAVMQLIDSAGERKALANKIADWYQPDAAERIAELVVRAGEGR